MPNSGQELCPEIFPRSGTRASAASNLAVTLAASRIQVDASADEGLVKSFIEKLGTNGRN